MRPRKPALLGSLSVAAILGMVAWMVPAMLGFEPPLLWIIRSVLLLFVLAVAGMIFQILRIRGRSRAPKERNPDVEKLDGILKEARGRLQQAGGGGKRLDNLPAILVLGPPASTKTTAVVQSGMEPELLAGEVIRDDVVVPTEGANLWYADGVVVVEASGDLVFEEGLWGRLVERLRPARLRAALLRGRQAPRVAVLCVGCDEFLKPGASRAIPDLARQLRTRLVEAAELLGVNLPVYVVFTRGDRLPYFDEFTRNLDHQEAMEVLGATLPFRSFESSARYGEDQSRRLKDALEGIHRGLARKRLDILPRENDENLRQAAYEFPRELRKLADPMREFLLELCRPGHLGASPILRGFYLTGVRAVVIDDPTLHAAPSAGAAQVETPVDSSATGVFKAPRPGAEPEPQASAARSGGARKVPQWLFLPGIFQRVVLQDGNAMGITGSGSRVSFVRRTLFGALTLAALVALVGMTVSLVSNRGLQNSVAEGLRGVEAPPPMEEIATGEEEGVTESRVTLSTAYLRQLETLGEDLDRLRAWDDGRPPLRYRWGLYSGDRLLPPVRAAYFERLRALLWEDTREALVAFLAGLPPEPTEDSDYERSYDALKAHLMTTRHPEESTAGFLTPVLMDHRALTAEGEEDERLQLVRAHYDRFARELAIDPPYDDDADQTLVAATRNFLGEFAAGDRFYQALVSRVSADLGFLDLTDRSPGARTTLQNDLRVPGAFTREGWEVVSDILDDPDGLLVSEEWVVGEQVVSADEREALARELEARYRQEYVERWRNVLRDGTVRNFASIPQAADALHTLSGNDSPIVTVLSAVSRNTRVDSDAVRAAFQPVHLLLPPAEAEDEDAAADHDGVREYLDQLMGLQASLDQLPNASGARLEQGLIQAERDAAQTRTTIARLIRDFNRDGEARLVGDHVEELLDRPVAHTTRLLGSFEATQAAGEINAQGASFCSFFGSAVSGFPFEPGSGTDADVDDVSALLQPGQSRLSTFHDEVMDELVVRQGGRWEARSGASPAPTSAFLGFYNEAHRMSDALFASGSQGPRVDFFIRIEASEQVPEVELQIDGQSQLYTRTSAPTRDFVWEGERAQTARLVARTGDGPVTVAEGSGPWGIFRLFHSAARWEDLGGGTHRVTWSLPGTSAMIPAEINFAGSGLPVFRPDYLAGSRCVAEIVR